MSSDRPATRRSRREERARAENAAGQDAAPAPAPSAPPAPVQPAPLAPVQPRQSAGADRADPQFAAVEPGSTGFDRGKVRVGAAQTRSSPRLNGLGGEHREREGDREGEGEPPARARRVPAPGRRRPGGFAMRLAVVLGILALVAGVTAAVSTAQGPRVTAVQVDPATAVTTAGARLIVTTTQSLVAVTPEQVTVTPETPFTVDTSGRSVGVRFTLPLRDETEYTVRIDDVTGAGGTPPAVIEQTFTTPALTLFALQRGSPDRVVRAGLAESDPAPVFEDAHIEDFRATATDLVVSTVDADDRSHLVVTALDGTGERELPLPGPGIVTGLQTADRGNLIGYTFTDETIGSAGARESHLFIASLRGDGTPADVRVTGADPRVADWRFVPGTDSILLLSYDGTLLLASSTGGDAVALGDAAAIDGIARASTLAVVVRGTERFVVDLSDAAEMPLAPTDAALGQLDAVVPLPDGSTLRVLSVVDGFRVVSREAAVVDAEGTARTIAALAPGDALLQACVSPNARYAALMVAPDLVGNPFDAYRLPLPERVETRIVALDGTGEVAVVDGSSPSWCQTPPHA